MRLQWRVVGAQCYGESCWYRETVELYCDGEPVLREDGGRMTFGGRELTNEDAYELKDRLPK